MNYAKFCRYRSLLPPKLVLGYAEIPIPGLKQPVRVPLCRYSPTPLELEEALSRARDHWGLDFEDLDDYQVAFTYGPTQCGAVKVANGCTYPGIRVTVALRPWGPTTWKITLIHEFAHVWHWERGGDGDPDHKLNFIWKRVPLVSSGSGDSK